MTTTNKPPAVLIKSKLRELELDDLQLLQTTAKSNDIDSFNLVWEGYGFDGSMSNLGRILLKNYKLPNVSNENIIDNQQQSNQSEHGTCSDLFKEIETNPITQRFYSKQAQKRSVESRYGIADKIIDICGMPANTTKKGKKCINILKGISDDYDKNNALSSASKKDINNEYFVRKKILIKYKINDILEGFKKVNEKYSGYTENKFEMDIEKEKNSKNNNIARKTTLIAKQIADARDHLFSKINDIKRKRKEYILLCQQECIFTKFDPKNTKCNDDNKDILTSQIAPIVSTQDNQIKQQYPLLYNWCLNLLKQFDNILKLFLENKKNLDDIVINNNKLELKSWDRVESLREKRNTILKRNKEKKQNKSKKDDVTDSVDVTTNIVANNRENFRVLQILIIIILYSMIILVIIRVV